MNNSESTPINKEKYIPLKERTKENDIKYLGPLTYRYIRLIAWVLLAFSQFAVVFRIASEVNPSLVNGYQVIGSISGVFSAMPLPLFLLANFGVIMHRRNDFRYLLTFYGGMAILMYVVANVVVIHFVFGLLNVFEVGSFWENSLIVGGLLSSIGNVGYVFNMFIDLFLCVLVVFFLNYKPRKFFARHIKLFRLMAVIPVVYELGCIAIKQLAATDIISVPSFFFFLLTSKPPFTFLAFVLISLVLKIREMRYLNKFKDEARLKEHHKTNAHSLRTSITISIIFALTALLDFVAVLVYVIIYANKVGFTPETIDIVTYEGIFYANEIGLGGSIPLLLVIPFVLLYSYTRQHKDKKMDSFVPFIGIGLIVLVYLEGGFEILRHVLNSVKNIPDESNPEAASASRNIIQMNITNITYFIKSFL